MNQNKNKRREFTNEEVQLVWPLCFTRNQPEEKLLDNHLLAIL